MLHSETMLASASSPLGVCLVCCGCSVRLTQLRCLCLSIVRFVGAPPSRCVSILSQAQVIFLRSLVFTVFFPFSLMPLAHDVDHDTRVYLKLLTFWILGYTCLQSYLPAHVLLNQPPWNWNEVSLGTSYARTTVHANPSIHHRSMLPKTPLF